MSSLSMVFQSLLGVLMFVVGAALIVSVLLTKDTNGVREKLLVVAICTTCMGVGVWFAKPALFLIGDLFTHSHGLARYAAERRLQDEREVASEARGFAWFTTLVAALNAPAAVACALYLAKSRPGAREPWFVLGLVLPLSAVTLAAKAQEYTGTALPERAFLAAVNDSLASAGIVGFLVLWCAVWMALIGGRYWAALPMGPLTAFLTPVATTPYYYGYYQHLAWWWMALLWLASVALGFIVNEVRKAENEVTQTWRNEHTVELVDSVLARVSMGDAPDYVLFLRPFRATGSLETQSGFELEGLDLETILARALKPRLLIGLGSNLERSVVGAGRVYFGDEEWWDNVKLLVLHAGGLIVIPSAHEGTLREIRWLHAERLLSKCVFVMPPTPGYAALQVGMTYDNSVRISDSPSVDQAALWSEAAAALGVAPGIQLPKYDPRGALLELDGEGRAVNVVPLGLESVYFKVRHLRRALTSVFPGALGTALVAKQSSSTAQRSP